MTPRGPGSTGHPDPVAICLEALGARGELDRDGNPSDVALQDLLGWVIVEFSRRVQTATDAGDEPLPPLREGNQVAETDVLIIARHLLATYEIAPFELAMSRF